MLALSMELPPRSRYSSSIVSDSARPAPQPQSSPINDERDADDRPGCSGDELFITTASHRLDAPERSAGGVFASRSGTQGLPSHRYAG
jgi:hypothetical protein